MAPDAILARFAKYLCCRNFSFRCIGVEIGQHERTELYLRRDSAAASGMSRSRGHELGSMTPKKYSWCVMSAGDVLGGQLEDQVGLSASSRSDTQLLVGQRT